MIKHHQKWCFFVYNDKTNIMSTQELISILIPVSMFVYVIYNYITYKGE